METLPAAQVIETLISLYGTLVFHTIYGLTGDWEESQDLTQDVFVKAWLLRIAVNTARMQQRRRSLMRFIPFSRLHEAQREEDDTDLLAEAMAPVQPAVYGTPDAGDPAEVVAEREAIQRTLAQIPEALRTPLLLSIVGRRAAATFTGQTAVPPHLHRRKWGYAGQRCRRGCGFWSREEDACTRREDASEDDGIKGGGINADLCARHSGVPTKEHETQHGANEPCSALHSG
jgi:DNA-directed RNA polymerase specialized sigma24 family protein